MDRFDKKTLEEKLKILKNMNDSPSLYQVKNRLISKLLIVLPSGLFVIGLFAVNGPQSLSTVFGFIFLSVFCIFCGVILFMLMNK